MFDFIDKETIAKVLGSRKVMPDDKKTFLGYKRIINNCDYSIYERPLASNKIIAACEFSVVKLINKNKLLYIPDVRVPRINTKIAINRKSFPGLKKDSHFAKGMFLPYLRRIKKDTYFKTYRFCIITSKGQIYHNYPSRSLDYEGLSLKNDFSRFEESVIWDLPGRKFPSNNETHKEYECYYPGLPSRCYSFTPMDNENPSYRDVYGNGGFKAYRYVKSNGINVLCSRFYLHSDNEVSNPFMFIGTGDKSDKMNLLCTYRQNVTDGCRICVFATSDGGREWFCKYEFSDFGEYAFQQGYSGKWGTNFGNKINIDEDYDDIKDELAVLKRNIVLPTENDGEAFVRFDWLKKARVHSVSSNSGLIITTVEPHNLDTGNIISINVSSKINGNYGKFKSFLSSKVDERGAIDGAQFKVRVIDDRSFELFELVSSQEPTLPCRHIHHANLLKDGWVIGTGEIYPNGWILFFEQKKADTFSLVDAADSFKIIRLNTCEKSVQRTMGVLLEDKREKNMVFASDHDTLKRNSVTDGFDFSRNSLGVFVGNISDINNRNAFECVFDANEPCYFFQKISGMLVYGGQRGELAISTDPDHKKWRKERLDRFIMNYFGQTCNYYYFNDYILLKK